MSGSLDDYIRIYAGGSCQKAFEELITKVERSLAPLAQTPSSSKKYTVEDRQALSDANLSISNLTKQFYYYQSNLESPDKIKARIEALKCRVELIKTWVSPPTTTWKTVCFVASFLNPWSYGSKTSSSASSKKSASQAEPSSDKPKEVAKSSLHSPTSAPSIDTNKSTDSKTALKTQDTALSLSKTPDNDALLAQIKKDLIASVAECDGAHQIIQNAFESIKIDGYQDLETIGLIIVQTQKVIDEATAKHLSFQDRVSLLNAPTSANDKGKGKAIDTTEAQAHLKTYELSIAMLDSYLSTMKLKQQVAQQTIASAKTMLSSSSSAAPLVTLTESSQLAAARKQVKSDSSNKSFWNSLFTPSSPLPTHVDDTKKPVDTHFTDSKTAAKTKDVATSSSSKDPISASSTKGFASISLAAEPSPRGFPNLGVTCYLNTFLKTYFFRNSEYTDVLNHKTLKEGQIVYGKKETHARFLQRQALLKVLQDLVAEVGKQAPSKDTIKEYLGVIANNQLLEPDMHPSVSRGWFVNDKITYAMGDARTLAIKVFDLLEMDADACISIQEASIFELTNEVKTKVPVTSKKSIDGATTSISLGNGEFGTTLQKNINGYFESEVLTEGNRWKSDGIKEAPSKKRQFIYPADGIHLPQRLKFTITPPISEYSSISNLTDIEDIISVPISDKDGKLIGHMEMELEDIGCNYPNAHFWAYLKEPNGTWTEHNDGMILQNLTKDNVVNGAGMNASRYGYQFGYRAVRYIPEGQKK